MIQDSLLDDQEQGTPQTEELSLNKFSTRKRNLLLFGLTGTLVVIGTLIFSFSGKSTTESQYTQLAEDPANLYWLPKDEFYGQHAIYSDSVYQNSGPAKGTVGAYYVRLCNNENLVNCYDIFVDPKVYNSTNPLYVGVK